jgi:hypothetical protein
VSAGVPFFFKQREIGKGALTGLNVIGIVQITILEKSEKATEPVIEFCPFCGMSNNYSEEPK